MKWFHFNGEHVRVETGLLACLSHIPNRKHVQMPRQPDDTVPRRPRERKLAEGTAYFSLVTSSNRQYQVSGQVLFPE